MQFEKFTQSKEEQRFAEKFHTQRDNIRQRGERGGGSTPSEGASMTQSKAPGTQPINLDEEQRPYQNNYFNLFEPIPVAGDDKTPPAGRGEYTTGAGDNTRNSRKTAKGSLRVQSAILG